MNAPMFPEVLLRSLSNADSQPALPLVTDGVARWVWEGHYGSMLIEVVGDEIYVNGQWVQQHPIAP